jgi:hypothetical protein
MDTSTGGRQVPETKEKEHTNTIIFKIFNPRYTQNVFLCVSEFTIELHVTESILISSSLLNWSRKFSAFVELQESLPLSQKPAICPYPEPL